MRDADTCMDKERAQLKEIHEKEPRKKGKRRHNEERRRVKAERRVEVHGTGHSLSFGWWT